WSFEKASHPRPGIRACGLRLPPARHRGHAVRHGVRAECDERDRAGSVAQPPRRQQCQGGRRSEAGRGHPRVLGGNAHKGNPLAHRRRARARVSPPLPRRLPGARRQGQRLCVAEHARSHPRRDLQRRRRAREGVGGAATLQRHAGRHGAADHAPDVLGPEAQGVSVQLRSEQPDSPLGRSLGPIYVVHGDEPLIALEAADAVRAAARARGFIDREVFEPGRSFDWSELAHSLASLSLFGGKKIVELRLPGGKPGVQGGEAIAQYCERSSPDILLLVSLPRLARMSQWSAWFSALSRAGVVVDVWPVERARLPAWISERLARQRQRAPREALEFLADRVEGNLLAAHQEVQKLALLAPEGELDVETVREVVANVARYDAY